MKNKGLTMSFIVEAESANYGEGFGNITTLKKMNRNDGSMYTYISRQALRYNIIEQLGWNNTPVEGEGSKDKKVIQFKADANIDQYPEIDLFGYMKTSKGEGASTRSAVARLSNAIALESYKGDLDFLTNMGLASRIKENNSIAQSEINRAFYAYTITIDLDRVGEDQSISLPIDEKIKRVNQLVETLQFLYRDIKGRRENLTPVFAIGGVYRRKNPFFANRLKFTFKHRLNTEMINQVLGLAEEIKENSTIGYLNGTFSNDKDIQGLNPLSIGDFFNKLKAQVEAAYNESN